MQQTRFIQPIQTERNQIFHQTQTILEALDWLTDWLTWDVWGSVELVGMGCLSGDMVWRGSCDEGRSGSWEACQRSHTSQSRSSPLSCWGWAMSREREREWEKIHRLFLFACTMTPNLTTSKLYTELHHLNFVYLQLAQFLSLVHDNLSFPLQKDQYDPGSTYIHTQETNLTLKFNFVTNKYKN